MVAVWFVVGDDDGGVRVTVWGEAVLESAAVPAPKAGGLLVEKLAAPGLVGHAHRLEHGDSPASARPVAVPGEDLPISARTVGSG